MMKLMTQTPIFAAK